QTFSNGPSPVNFVTTLRIFRIGTAKDRPMSATPLKADIGGSDLFMLTPELLRHRFPRSRSPAHQYLAFPGVRGKGIAKRYKPNPYQQPLEVGWAGRLTPLRQTFKQPERRPRNLRISCEPPATR